MIAVRPGAQFEATLSGASGLVGTLGVRIRDGAGADFLARTTAGVAADVTVGATSLYRRTFTAPTVAGQFWIVWDNGTVVLASEELSVLFSAVAAGSASPLYVQEADMLATLGLTGSSEAAADVPGAIAAACRGIDTACNRQFYPDADTVRYYTPLGSGAVMIDDLYDLTSVETDHDGDGTFEQDWTENTGFVLEPINNPAKGWPFTRITRLPGSGFAFPAGRPRSVKVSGSFGWAETPDAIVEATAILATQLLRRKREAPFGIVAVGLEGQAMRIARSDPQIQFLIGDYMREAVG